MYNFYQPMPRNEQHANRSAFEIAAAAHEHEKRLVELRPYGGAMKQAKAADTEDSAGKIAAFWKAPIRLLSIAGQWIFTL